MAQQVTPGSLARMKAVKEMPENSRPREKLSGKGAWAATDEELVVGESQHGLCQGRANSLGL